MTRGGLDRAVGMRVARAVVGVGVDVGRSVLVGSAGGGVDSIVAVAVAVAVAGAVGARSVGRGVGDNPSSTSGGRTRTDAESGAASALYNRKKTPVPRSKVTKIPTTVNGPGFSPSSAWYTASAARFASAVWRSRRPSRQTLQASHCSEHLRSASGGAVAASPSRAGNRQTSHACDNHTSRYSLPERDHRNYYRH